MNTKNILFITGKANRGLYLLGRQLHKLGCTVTIAAPGGSQHFWMWGEFIRLRRIGKFLLGSDKIQSDKGTRIFALDYAAARFATRAKLRFSPAELNFGLDPVVWTPDSATMARQQRILSEYGIAPHQKMIAVISPLGVKLDELLNAVKSLPRNDFVIALTGAANGRFANKVLKKIANSGTGSRVICTGNIMDMPSFLRAAFATMSLGGHSEQLLKAAVSMGRPTIWGQNDFNIKPNIVIKENLVATLNSVLNLKDAQLDAYQKTNLGMAKNFSIEKTVKEFLEKFKI